MEHRAIATHGNNQFDCASESLLGMMDHWERTEVHLCVGYQQNAPLATVEVRGQNDHRFADARVMVIADQRDGFELLCRG
jgi:hypothetical protein